MPYLKTSAPKSDATKAWQTAFKNALVRRITAERLAGPLKTLKKRDPVRPLEIANILLGFRSTVGGGDDPRLFSYANLLLNEKYITTSDLLLALLRNSSYGARDIQSPESIRRTGMPSCEERIFLLLIQTHMTVDLPTSPLELQQLVHALWRWLKIVSEHEMGKQLEGGGMHTVDAYVFGIYEALGSLAVSVFQNQSIRVLSKQAWWKEKRTTVVTEMENFDNHILQWMQSQMAGRLKSLTGVPPFIALDEKGRPIFTNEQIVGFISEMPMVHSRAALFVWLNAALVARPLTDDMTLLSYLQARYPGDTQNLIVDLLVASFDVLTNAILREEHRQNVKIIRSFLCNKVPLLLSMLSANTASTMAPEACIQMALMPGGMISVDVLPPITKGASGTRDFLKGARLDFLQSCVLHGVLSESAVSQILGESVALPRVTKFSKESLLAQCSNNVSRFETMIEDLDGMQGNCGAIAGCVVEHVTSLCMHKDHMALKSVCNALIKKIRSMDLVMQYTEPAMLLLPLCRVLNDWTHDQDQAEFTPSYEEFASILLFTLAIIHRYDLHWSDFGLVADTFMSRLLDNMSVARPLNELSPEQASQLGKWVEGLFTVDEHGEASGIGDDVMGQCSPQSFYQLVPTLFEQTILACQMNSLPLKTLKGGLELLLEPFLLPSLAMGLKWLAKHSWEDHNNVDILLQVLDKLLKPSSSSQDTKNMHMAVMYMVAQPLTETLQDLVRKQPDKKKAIELLDVLKPFLGQQRSLDCTKEELDQWTQNAGGLTSRIQQGVRELIDWSVSSSSAPNPPPKYTYKEFAVACQVLDSGVLVDSIVEVVMQNPNMTIALDIATTVLCAPTPTSVSAQQSSMSSGVTAKVRNSLRLTASNVQGLLEMKQLQAETLVRLGRRVEDQLSVAQLPPIHLPMNIPDQTADQIMKDMGIDLTGDASGGNGETSMDQNSNMTGLEQHLDLSNPVDQELANMAANPSEMDAEHNKIFDDMGIDLTQGQDSGQGMDTNGNQDDDIFAGLADMDNMGGMADFGDDDFSFG